MLQCMPRRRAHKHVPCLHRQVPNERGLTRAREGLGEVQAERVARQASDMVTAKACSEDDSLQRVGEAVRAVAHPLAHVQSWSQARRTPTAPTTDRRRTDPGRRSDRWPANGTGPTFGQPPTWRCSQTRPIRTTDQHVAPDYTVFKISANACSKLLLRQRNPTTA